MQILKRVAWMTALLGLCGGAAGAQEPSVAKASQPAAQEAPKDGAPVAVTLKRAIELALQNSKEIQVAKIQASVADRSAQITKAQFMPNLYAGSGRISMRAPARGIPTAYRKRRADERHRSSTCRTRNKFSTNRCGAKGKRCRSSPKRRRLRLKMRRTGLSLERRWLIWN